MKNLLFLLLSCLTVSGRAQTGDDALLQEFINSPDYAAFIAGSSYGQLGTPDLKQSFVGYSSVVSGEIEKQVPVLYIQFAGVYNGKKKVVGQLQAIKVREDYSGLPRNGRYLMLFKDLRQFNADNSSGTIRVYDLNYDEYLSGEAVVNNWTVNNYTPFPVPDQVSAKYNLTGRAAHPCDANGNGNVTFGECFSCMMGACMRDTECRTLCLIANLFQWRCTMAMRLSCRIIAIIY